ncbi:putative IMPACT [Toxoplasma gondii CAST]|uniref:Putative IMPACT n=1 Tax=Toxoplasma gondii CAST TaxID=943122 RepID=A0A425I217_TOXGO|nr:putative IMPACT [Toxoplasma gondii CAST]
MFPPVPRWSPPPFSPCDCPAASQASAASSCLSEAAAEELEALRSIYGEDEIRFHPCCRLVQVRTETTRSRVRDDAGSLLTQGACSGEAQPDCEDDDKPFWFLLQLFLPVGYLDPDFQSPACLVHTPWEQPREALQRMQNQLLALQGEALSSGNPGLFDIVECVRSYLPLPPPEVCAVAPRERREGMEEDLTRKRPADAGDGLDDADSKATGTEALDSQLSSAALAAKREGTTRDSRPTPNLAWSPGRSISLYIGSTVTVHKSRFIGVCAAVRTAEEVQAVYQQVKQMHFGATHHIMAYSFLQKVTRRGRGAPQKKENCPASCGAREQDVHSPSARLCALRVSSPAAAGAEEEERTPGEAPGGTSDAVRTKRNRARRSEKDAERKGGNAEISKEDTFIENCDHDSDGETGAGRKLQQLLYNLKAKNVILIVTRWYGGIHLGPDRFRVIASVGRQALDASGLLEQKDPAKKEANPKRASSKGEK